MPPRFFYASAQGVECRGIYVVLAEGSIWRRIQGFTARCRRGGDNDAARCVATVFE